MDKNQAIGFVLIALMFILYIQFFSDDPQPLEPAPNVDSLSTLNIPREDSIIRHEDALPVMPDSLVDQELKDQYGIFSSVAKGEEKIISLENELLNIEVNSKGGQMESVELKTFETFDHRKLILFNKSSNQFALALKDTRGRKIDLTKLYYQPVLSKNDSATVLNLTANLGNGKQINIEYQLQGNTYLLGYSVRLKNLQGDVSAEDMEFNWSEKILNLEHDITTSRSNATVKYYTLAGDYDDLSESSTSFKEEEINESIKWLSVKQKFFTAGIIAENKFNKAYLTTDVDPNDTLIVKTAAIKATIPMQDLLQDKGNFQFYFGPNDYHILSSVTDGFDKNLYLGWPPVSYVNKFVIIPLFDVLNNFMSNYGLIIIIMVFVIKLVLSPLSYKSYLSMAKMKVLKPELDKIKENNKDDMTKTQQEQMKLYQQVGVNPLSGCVPVVLQMPILFAMFYFFPQSIQLRQQGFLWADDLSTYDSIATLPFTIPGYGDHVSLFVLLMTLSTILYTWSNNQISSVQGPMKTFSYVMPVIFMFVLNSFPAALSFYYFVSNIITFGQQALIRKFVNEDKIKAVLEENRKKNVNKKKSAFQLKLEDAMKAGDAKEKKKKK